MYSSTIHTHACIEPSFLSTVIRKFPAFDSGGYFFFRLCHFLIINIPEIKQLKKLHAGKMNTTERKLCSSF